MLEMNSKRKESRASQQSYDNTKREFHSAISDIAKHGGISHGDAFSSFLTAAFGALLQACNLVKCGRADKKLEASVVAEQQKGGAESYGKAMSAITQAFSCEQRDFLGEYAGKLSILSKGRAQYFTPHCVSKLLPQLARSGIDPKKNSPYVFNEPACGSGGTIISALETIKTQGLYPWEFYFVAQDVDFRCVQMTFIQTTMAGIPCVVQHADTLNQAVYNTYTNLPMLLHHPLRT